MANTKRAMRVLAVVLCLCAVLCACQRPAEPTTTIPTAAQDAIYTITVTSPSGRIPQGITAYVYTDSSKTKLVDYRQMDENGTFTFTAKQSDQYVLVLQGVPEGYDLKEMYPLTATNTEVVLTSSPVAGMDATDKIYNMGDVIRDFTITDTDGAEHTISEILKTKQAVVLNFWYTSCNPCKKEFPFLQSAYEQYSDKVEVIAMSPSSTGDTVEKIAQFKTENGLTFPMALCDAQWQQAMSITGYPTTVVIDRYGVICLMNRGEVTEEEIFLGVFAHFTAEDYQQQLVEDVNDLDTIVYAEGHAKNPLFHGGPGDIEVTVEPGKEFHINAMRADGLIMRVENAEAYIIYEGVRYDPDENGVIELNLHCPDIYTPAQLIVGTTGETANTVKASLTIPPGTMNNPYEMELGTTDMFVEGANEMGVFYQVTAETAGTLVFTVNSASSEYFDIQLYNLTAYVVKTLSMDGAVDADGNAVLRIAVNEGDVVRINFISTFDEDGNCPDVNIQALVTILDDGGKITYSVSVIDGEGNPIPGAEVRMTIDGVPTIFVTDETGRIAVELFEGNYTIQLIVPDGYITETTQFLLTAANPDREIVLTPYVPQEIDYTITIVDGDGAPLSGVSVIVDGQFRRTDEQGTVVFTLLKGSYTAEIVPPEGYTAESTSYSFGEEETFTITLRKIVVETPVKYTVTITDVFGNPFTNTVVSFVAPNGTVTRCNVNADGQASAYLAKGSYTVELLLSGTSYDKSSAKLTATETSVTIVVGKTLSGIPDSITISGTQQPAHSVGVGGTYAEVTAMGTTYFLFTPAEEGIYKIAPLTAGTVIENWGFKTAPQQSVLGIVDNVLTLEVTEVGATYVFAIKAAYHVDSTMLKISMMPLQVEETYQGTTVPTERYEVIAPAGAVKQYLSMNGADTIVKGTDGFYHLNTADGPIVMVDLRELRYGISIAALLDGGNMYHFAEASDGEPAKITDYTECMNAYLVCADEMYGVYALTDDLMTMIYGHGQTAGWWDSGSENYLFDAVSDLNPDSAWMFLLCTIQGEQEAGGEETPGNDNPEPGNVNNL